MADLPPGFEIDAPSGGPPDGFEIDKPDMSWSDVGSQTIENAPESAKRFAAPYYDALTDPAGTWWNQVKNVSQIGAGVIQHAADKLGLDIGQGYEKHADAVGQFYADRYGSMEGFKRAIANDPVGVMADAASVLAPLTSGARNALGRTPKATIPSTEELFDAAGDAYGRMRNYGIEIHPRAAADVATNARTELETEGYRDFTAPKTFRALDELNNPAGKYSTISDIDAARKVLGKAGADPAERDAARRAIGHIDDFIANLDPNDVVINPHFTGAVADAAKDARGNYAAAKRSEVLDDAMDRAERRTNATGSGGNINNVLRQEANRIINSRALSRGFNDAELAELKGIANGSTGANVARGVGKVAPTGIVSAIGGEALGEAAEAATGIPGLKYAFPAGGYAAKKIGDMSTIKRFQRLHEMVRGRSPLAHSMPPIKPPASNRGIIAGPILRQGRQYEAQQ